MNFKCLECGNLTERKIDSHHYVESGLDNVHLQNIPVYKCGCGMKYPSILRVGYLNEKIGEALIEKRSLLSGKEIKFLRKNLYLSSKIFASMIGIGATTLSKWENEHQRHRDANDRLIRIVYMVYKVIKNDITQKILKKLSNIRLQQAESYYVILAEFCDDEYIVKMQPIFGAFSSVIENTMLNKVGVQATSACSFMLSSGYSHMETDHVFASNEMLMAKSNPNQVVIKSESR